MDKIPLKRQIKKKGEFFSTSPFILIDPLSHFLVGYELQDRSQLNIITKFRGGYRSVELESVHQIKVERPKSIFLRLINIGTLVFYTSGTNSTDQFRWENVSNPDDVKNFIWQCRKTLQTLDAQNVKAPCASLSGISPSTTSGLIGNLALKLFAPSLTRTLQSRLENKSFLPMNWDQRIADFLVEVMDNKNNRALIEAQLPLLWDLTRKYCEESAKESTGHLFLMGLDGVREQDYVNAMRSVLAVRDAYNEVMGVFPDDTFLSDEHYQEILQKIEVEWYSSHISSSIESNDDQVNLGKWYKNKLSNRARKAMVRLELIPPFTREELDQKIKISIGAGKSTLEAAKNDYDLLLPLVS